MTELVLVPAACYPVYPAVAARGRAAGGRASSSTPAARWVFRHEPLEDPARMQMFHQREIVRLGAPEPVLAWRDAWSQRGLELLARPRPGRRARPRQRPVLRARADGCSPPTSASRS